MPLGPEAERNGCPPTPGSVGQFGTSLPLRPPRGPSPLLQHCGAREATHSDFQEKSEIWELL